MKSFNYRYSFRTGYLSSRKLNLLWKGTLIAFSLLFFIGFNAFAQKGKSPAASLEQIRNGASSNPTDPAQWQNGNAGNQTAHYVESHSIGYRALLTNLPANTQVTLILGYDVRHSSKNAIDFLTHYDRLEPHGQFGHDAEEVDPTIGTSFAEGSGFSVYEIPRPEENITVNGKEIPGDVWDALPAVERLMTLWGGTIDNIQYVTPGADLSEAQSEQRIIVTFTTNATGGSAVLAWGGHIANRRDWGYDANNVPLSAGGISGSPYHMRLIDWNLSNLGNQDRSLSAAAVVPLVECAIAGPDPVCGAESNTYTATTDAPDATFVWSITDGNGTIVANSQTTTATGSGGTQSTIGVTAGASGSFTLSVQITAPGFLAETCSKIVIINPIPAEPDDSYIAPACDETTFSVRINSPLADATYILKDKCGETIPNVTSSITTPSTAPANITFTGIPAGSGYQITVTKGGCTSAPASCGTCTTSQGTTLDKSSTSSSAIKSIEKPADKSVIAYPVPFRSKVNVEFKSELSGNYTISLYDSKGKLVRELKSGKAKAGQLQNLEVDGQNLPEGMYFIRVIEGSGARTVKLLKKE